ncbi:MULTISPECIES: hypothetical protein [unclassified Micromonospora]|uniref:hypothetical protein n=1 Tax=unclassified Micromonospora TaxID=2617518 RepID=UPI001183D15D|nr:MULTISPECIES: hypothetical protein [unclassified Micromonospora]
MTRRLALLSVALVASALLTGCGSVTIPIPTGDGGSVEVDTNGDGSVTVNGDGGSVTTGSGLPKGFPADEVPVIEGRVTGAMAIKQADGTQGYTFVVVVDDDIASATDKASGLLTDAGYKLENSVDSPGSTVRSLGSDAWMVVITVAAAEQGSGVNYVVATREQ